MAKLIIYEESDSETVFETFELFDTHILIGSDPDNHLILETPEIDPSHASLELRNDYWILQDLGGPGGTSVNGQVIDGPHQLFHDDMIELGIVRMRFQDPERGITQVLPPLPPENGVNAEADPQEAEISGRVWFATISATTIVIIFIIIFLIIVAHFLGLINIGDLLSF